MDLSETQHTVVLEVILCEFTAEIVMAFHLNSRWRLLYSTCFKF